MTIDPDRWEHGSEFHWFAAARSKVKPAGHPWLGRALLFGSGRDGLRSLIRHGAEVLGWKRILVPSFLCQEVVAALISESLRVEAYQDDPQEQIHAPHPGRGDALLVVNTFGVRPRWRRPRACAGAVIEDHTHDPWSHWAQTSDADYCVASLRKTLPVPDGGVVWSPREEPMPAVPELTAAHHAAASRKLEAMLLKALFLEGGCVKKEAFRSLALSGEGGIANPEVSTIHPVSAAVVDSMQPAPWRARRIKNFRTLTRCLDDRPEFTILHPRGRGSCAFSAVLVCAESSIRNRLLCGLIERRIYPAVLWPLEERRLDLPLQSVELSRRVLSIHCDGRYDEADMVRVASAIAASLP